MNTTRTGISPDRIFALVGGGILIAVGLLILSRVYTAIHAPAHLYEATATFALYPANGSINADGGLQTAWSLLPNDAAVGLEPDPQHPNFCRLSFQSPDPAQAVAQANAMVATMQANTVRANAGRFQIIHPADAPVEQSRPRGRMLAGDAVLLLLALAPVYFGVRLALRHRPVPLQPLPS